MLIAGPVCVYKQQVDRTLSGEFFEGLTDALHPVSALPAISVYEPLADIELLIRQACP
jgi:hypothetical protein